MTFSEHSAHALAASSSEHVHAGNHDVLPDEPTHGMPSEGEQRPTVLTIRSHSGLSGDMLLAGLLCMTGLEPTELNARLAAIMPELSGSVTLVRHEVRHIGGWRADVALPHQHVHRTLEDILSLIHSSTMTASAREMAEKTFVLLAEAEGKIHGKPPEAVQFHEVGALDSILDICLSCELLALLAPGRIIVSPLPMADGSIRCAHGVIPAPAPAVLELLENIPVRSFPDAGETVTPTALALLRSMQVSFGRWPAMVVEKQALVYGTRVFPTAPNGALFAYGHIWED